MNSTIPLIFQASVFVSIIAATPSSANVSGSMNKPQAELLADGNIRDPEPTPADLKDLVSTTNKNMVYMPEGTFDMGDWGPEVRADGLPFDGTLDSKPLHEVTLSGFSIGKYPVTYAEFDIFTAAVRLPRINQSDYAKRFRKPDNPAGVSWQGAKDYCQWLGKLSGQLFDLPTEAQWEYGARSGGQRYLYPTDNGESEPGRNLPSYEQRDAAGGLVAVSSFPPNKAGIYSMSAGILEFTNDWYDPHYYEKSPKINPTGPAIGTFRVVRGFFGSDSSAMTIKRWAARFPPPTKSWTSYGVNGAPNREIPPTQYSNYEDNAFRCVLNQHKRHAPDA